MYLGREAHDPLFRLKEPAMEAAHGYSDAVKDIVTGVILLAAVTLDTVSRRGLAAAGR